MKASKRLFSIISAIILFGTTTVFAGELTMPHKFASGNKAVAAEVNANFEAVVTEVNDNDVAITENVSAISDNEARLTQTESDTSANYTTILSNFSILASNSIHSQQYKSNICNQ